MSGLYMFLNFGWDELKNVNDIELGKGENEFVEEYY